MSHLINNSDYLTLLVEVKKQINVAKQKAISSVNAQLLVLYFNIGKIISTHQKEMGWGAKVISKIAVDIKNELPEIKGFSKRNINLMVQFYLEYKTSDFGKLVISQNDAGLNVQPLVAQIPWTHNVILMQKIKDNDLRQWYMQKILENGWSKNILVTMLNSNIHKREAKLASNFKQLIPAIDSDLVQQSFKDPYIFDFLTIDSSFRERELELNLVANMEKFLIELGSGFAFVGRQYKLEVGSDEFYIDLLFYHLKLRCFVVIELKKGKFKPEYSGQVNFYCSAVDDLLAQKDDKPTIGLILCQEKNEIVAEYSLKTTTQPIGISKYELTEILPKELESSLPTIEEIEAEFGIKKTSND